MPAKPTVHMKLDETVVAGLACPACWGDLRLKAERLVCAGCGRGYPVVDGIPVLIAERAETEDTKA
jgi:uncharacterized protein YbaR (Trm112 family)